MERQQSNSTDPSNSICNLLEVVRLNCRIVDLIAQTLIELSAKRITLEEKMIQNHFVVTANHSSRAVCGVTSILNSSISTEVEALALELKLLCHDIIPALEEFLKMIRYNPNFLEQYYEYGFNERLLYEHRFAERMESISSKLCAAISVSL